MKSFIIFAVLTFSTLTAFSQTKPIKGPLTYGPIPYRTLEQTIGEDYVVLPMDQFEKEFGYSALKKGEEDEYSKLKDSTIAGKILKLESIDDKGYAHLVSSYGEKYLCKKINAKYQDIVPIYDINEAKKRFFQKTVWLNHTNIQHGSDVNDNGPHILDLRFEPLKVIDVTLGDRSSEPVNFVLQTTKGEVGHLAIDVSGTNTDRRFIFEKYFFEQDPKTLYHFTPQEWRYIKAGLPQIGMSTEAVRLCIGSPNDINRTVAGKTITEQYVYGFNTFSYYYFTNGKLTAIQH